MAEELTLARPYAEAVHRLAMQHNAFAQWSDMLALTASVAQDEQIVRLATDPNCSDQQLERLLLAVCGAELSEQGVNFIKLLVENGRIGLLPRIQELYEKLRAEQSGEIDASVTSAFPMTDAQLAELVAVLERRFKRKIKATVKVDPELIGGVMVVAGDEVLDDSVRGKLQTMANALKG
jgi:F-type H+-transporting ATPase subunit delta